MNAFYIAKKTSYYCSLLNIIGSIAWFLLIFLIIVYHFFILIDPSGNTNYSILTNSEAAISESSSTSGVVNSIQQTNHYSKAFIENLGYQNFFFGVFLGSITFWTPIYILFILALTCFTIKTVLNIFVLFVAIKSYSMIYIYTALVDIFCPLIGGIYGLRVAKSNCRIEGHKAIYPLHWLKFKTKDLMSKILFDPKYKTN